MTGNQCSNHGCTEPATVAIGIGPFERRVCQNHVDGYTIQRTVA